MEGLILLFVLGGIPAAIGIYFIWGIEKNLSKGCLSLYQDEQGNYVIGKDGLPLCVDERGKVFSGTYAKQWVRRVNREMKAKSALSDCWMLFNLIWFYRTIRDRNKR